MNIYKMFKRVIMLSALVTLSFFDSFCYSGTGYNTRGPGIQSDTSVSYRYPLDVTMSLSGNYGELRSNHFHAGIDFRVGGVVGAPIYAAERGYISRISVSPSGYGNALYITHPNGQKTVYGHMHCFADEIAEFVRDKQYEQESFNQNIHLTPEQFPVKKGDYIGKAGNTGSSGGPHLHFEIRDADDQTTNAFARGYLSIQDNTPPVVNNLVFYGFEHNGGVPQSYYIGMPKKSAISLPEYSYICIDAVDKQEGTHAKLAVNEYKVYLDNDLIFHFNLGEVPSSIGKDINSLIEFKQKVVRGRTYVKSYLEPGNLLKDRIKTKNSGIITLKDTLPHKLRVEVVDIEDNRTFRSVTVKRVDSLFIGKITDTLQGVYAPWFLPNVYKDNGFSLYIPQGVLYNSINLCVDTLPQRVTQYAPVWRVNTNRIALRRAVTVAMECSLPDEVKDKAFLAFVNRSGRLGYAGGELDTLSGMIRANVLSLGDFTVGVDLDAPQITPSFSNGAVVRSNSLVFRIRDNLSGIGRFRVEIDGHWVLAEYDAKTRRLIVPLQHARIKRGIKHNLTIKVVDNVGNENNLKRVFTW